jgi:D-alanyl-D-alanine dipeptidase
MGHDHSERLARARRESEAAGLDAVVVAPGPDLLYLIGYGLPPLERLTALIVRPERDPVLLVPELERQRAAASPAGRLVEFATWRDGESAHHAARRLLPDRGTFGVIDQLWARHLIELERECPDATFVPASRVLSRLRIRKDAGELELLARSGRSADQAFAVISGEELSGRTEDEVSQALRRHLVEAGCHSPSFWIVGSGPHSASPHHEPGARTIVRGDPVVLDFGGRVGGYGSDLTRTVSVGEPSRQVKEVHEIVLQAQEASFRAIRPGVTAEQVDHAARHVIEEAGYGAAFIHRTGHGIGLEEHEEPYIVRGNTQLLEPGMCFSIEPGIYLEDRFGVRIEDIVAVTEDGAVRLNNAPRELTVVD